MTERDFEHGSTPVTWSIAFRGVGDHVLGAVAILAVAPRPLWAWVVLVQPAIALVAVPWFGTLALAAFAVLSVAPAAIAWGVAIGQRRLRYTVSPTRASLRVRDLWTDSDNSEPADVDLDDVGGVAAVPLRGRVAVRFRGGRPTGADSDAVPRVVLVPADRWPGVAASLTRAGVSLPWGETPDQTPPLSLIAIVAVSAIVPIAGVAVGAVLGFQWLVL